MDNEFLERVKKTREYLDYIENHYNNVQKAWGIIKNKCDTCGMRFMYDDFFYFNINNDIFYHDISKLSAQEFVQYRENFFPTLYEETQKGTAQKIAFENAWEHHKRSNQHHWENWTKSGNIVHPDEWEMHCVHMIADWMAMGFKFGDTAKEYYEKNKNKFNFEPNIDRFINQIFELIYNDKD